MATAALIPLARKSRDKLTVAEVCEDLQIAQSTFYEWRTKGTGPRCLKLPNGQLHVRRADLEAWLDDVAAPTAALAALATSAGTLSQALLWSRTYPASLEIAESALERAAGLGAEHEQILALQFRCPPCPRTGAEPRKHFRSRGTPPEPGVPQPWPPAGNPLANPEKESK